MSLPHAQLLELIGPVAARVASLKPDSRTTAAAVAALEAELERRFPAQGELGAAIRVQIARGVAQGWLCDRGEPHARFCRLAKPTPDTFDLSIDLVSLLGTATPHTHTLGEVTLGFPADADIPWDLPRFDGRSAGWVFLGPGTTHAPAVTGARMHLLYFLPRGAVVWL